MARYLAPIFLASLLPLAAGSSCNADNCLRALRAPSYLGTAEAFCATFTVQTITATASIPTYVANACVGNVVSRVSSACSCIATLATASTSTSISTSTPTSTSISTSTSTSTSTSAPTSTPTSTFISTSTSSSASTSSSTSISTSTSTSSSTSAAPTSTSGSEVCLNTQLSCHNTTAVADTCCFNAPGGELLVTQFWDTNPSTGPSNAWTIHGLWPDNCDGTYGSFCDPAREYYNITAILTSYGATDLLAFMSRYWKDYGGNDESFWEHEWNKHGTCISTLEPSCYHGYTPQEEVVDFFQTAVDMYKTLDSYNVLAAAGIVPSLNTTYTYAQIEAAITVAHGYNVAIQCASGALDELWYYYNVLGSVQTGEFVPTAPVGYTSSCPQTGIKYLPKYMNATSSTTTTSATPSATLA